MVCVAASEGQGGFGELAGMAGAAPVARGCPRKCAPPSAARARVVVARFLYRLQVSALGRLYPLGRRPSSSLGPPNVDALVCTSSRLHRATIHHPHSARARTRTVPVGDTPLPPNSNVDPGGWVSKRRPGRLLISSQRRRHRPYARSSSYHRRRHCHHRLPPRRYMAFKLEEGQSDVSTVAQVGTIDATHEDQLVAKVLRNSEYNK